MAPKSRRPVDARMRGTDTKLIILAIAGSLFGCAAPGTPVTRRPAVPQAISDLSAKQSGASVVLSFTLPNETVDGRPLSRPPAVEIYRAFGNSGASESGLASGQLGLLTTVPPEMVNEFEENGRIIHFSDVFTTGDLSAHAGGDVTYIVRARSARHDSDASNLVRVHIFPAPEPIKDLHADITQTAVELSWTPPSVSPANTIRLTSLGYEIYRCELPASALSSAKSNQVSALPQVILLGRSDTPSYGDRHFVFGRAYRYIVRTVATYKDGSVESADSNLLNVTPRDTFAPATPQDLAATAAGLSGSAAPHVDLSWAINGETDLLGYNIYRSDEANGLGIRLNSIPLMTPVFRDESVVPGKEYFYRVTAIDRAGNETAPSAPVAVTVPASNE